MKTHLGSASRFSTLLALALMLAACAQAPKSAPVPSPAPATPPIAAVDAPVPPAPRPDPALITSKQGIITVQRALIALGYTSGKADGKIGRATIQALIASEKDHGLPVDVRLTIGLAEKIRSAAEEAVHATVITVHPGDFLIYSDGKEEIATTERSLLWDQDPPGALIAIRPAMGGWPAAARAGLDWALTHALETPASSTPLKWSSTGVDEQFEIRTYAQLTPREASLVGGDPAKCRRFE